MVEKDKIIYISVDDIIPNRFQPRLAFDERELNSLADSIKKYGVIQPIVLRKIGDKYEIIAGERRYKASLIAGLNKIPSIINQTDDNTSAEIALLENLQRKNLTVIEESQSYKKLLDRGFTQEEIATKLGISQSSIANKLRLLNLPKQVQEALLYNKISERHARSLLSLNDSELQKRLLDKIINEKLTVKQTEDEISKILNTSNNSTNEKQIQEYLDIKVPDVISIPNDNNIKEEISTIEDNSLSINPFQMNFIDNNENKEQIQKQENHDIQSDNEEKLERLDFSLETSEPINEELPSQNISSVKKLSIPKVIEKVRDLVNDININAEDILSTTELDLVDKYQIIINIKKDN